MIISAGRSAPATAPSAPGAPPAANLRMIHRRKLLGWLRLGLLEIALSYINNSLNYTKIAKDTLTMIELRYVKVI